MAILNKSSSGDAGSANKNGASTAADSNSQTGHHNAWHNKSKQEGGRQDRFSSGSKFNSQAGGGSGSGGPDSQSQQNPGNKNNSRMRQQSSGGGSRQPGGGREAHSQGQRQHQGSGQNSSTGNNSNHNNNSASGNSNSNNRSGRIDHKESGGQRQQQSRQKGGAGGNDGGAGMGSFGFQGSYGADGRLGQLGHGQDGIGPYTAFERQHFGPGDTMKTETGQHSKQSYNSEMSSGTMPMTQSITQMFSGGRGGRNADDGGYAKTLGGGPGAGEHFGGSNDGYGGDFAKVDFDKPLFGGKDSSAEAAGFGARSQYSSSCSKTAGGGQEHPSQQKLVSKDVSGQAIRTDMPLASEMGKMQQSLQKQSGHDFSK